MDGWLNKSDNKRGFTIVELPIVIVVIAILAAITIVAFNGLQQRARNSAKMSVVESVSKLVQLYKTDNDQLPATSTVCLTTDNKCTNYDGSIPGSSNTALIQTLSQYGTVPSGTQDNTSAGLKYGVEYLYKASMTLDGAPNPLIIMFWLDGTNQNCTGIAGMISVKDSTPSGNMTEATASNGNTGVNQTRCYMMFPS